MSIEHLMMEFTRLIEQRAAGDDSPELDRRIGYAATALLVAQLRDEKAKLLARLAEIDAELLSPDVELPGRADRRYHSSGRAIDYPVKPPPSIWPERHDGHIHWAG